MTSNTNKYLTGLFPSEVDYKKFSVLEPINRGKESWSARIIYDGETLKIQTPPLLIAFDLNAYRYGNSTRDNYSICVSLDDNINGVAELKQLIKQIDTTAINTYKDKLKTETFISSIKDSKDEKFPPLLRCKMVNNKTRFKCSFRENGQAIGREIDEIKNRLKKGIKVKLVLQLNPVWKVDNKYGVSWQILLVDIIQPVIEFRNDFE